MVVDVMTHHHPASVTQAHARKDEAWSNFDVFSDMLQYYAEHMMTPPAGFYSQMEHARQAWLEAEAEYTKIYRAAEALEARRRERQAEAEINTVEDEPVAEFEPEPEQSDLADEADYERQDWLMQSYPNQN